MEKLFRESKRELKTNKHTKTSITVHILRVIELFILYLRIDFFDGIKLGERCIYEENKCT